MLTACASLDTYTLVQAKSAEEPCTRDPRGLYAEFTKPSDEMKNDPDIDQKMGLGYALYIPYSANESSAYDTVLLGPLANAQTF